MLPPELLPLPRCQFCGCTDLNACVHEGSGAACSWALRNVCSYCALALEQGDEEMHALAIASSHGDARDWYLKRRYETFGYRPPAPVLPTAA